MTQRFYSLTKKVRQVSTFFVARNFIISIILGLLASSPALAAQSSPSWEQIVAGAEKEGEVSIIGPQGSKARDALTLAFQKKYPNIKVAFQGMSGAQVSPKLFAELAAGRNTTDLVIAGTSTTLTSLLPAKALVPLKPFLSGPNTRDPNKWLGGKLKFADDAGMYNLVFSQYVKPPFVFNSKQLSGNEFKSWKDLLDPKWQGKIELRDPRIAGAGQQLVTLWYVTEGLGKDFIRKFLTQKDLMIARDDGQMLDACAQGKYPIAVGPGDVPTNEYINKGLPLKQIIPESIKEGTYVTAGNGSLVIPRDAPHPNALRVYLDFMLSQEGQLEWSKGIDFASLRRDVSHSHVQDIFVPKEGVRYMELSDEKYVLMKDEIMAFIKTLMKR